MIQRRLRAFCAVIVAALATALLAAPAAAHPHVWVTMKAELVYAPDGTLTAVRHAWTFDDSYSTFATQGLAQKEKGKFTREELADLASVNVTSLKEFDFFTAAKADGKKIEFADPKDYYAEYANDALTMHFLLPLKKPVKARVVVIEMYDPSVYVDFAFPEKEPNPVALTGAPAGCKLTAGKPQNVATASKPIGEAFFNSPDAANYGAQFANKILVACP